MISRIIIVTYIIVSLILLGLTASVSDTHYEYIKKYGGKWSAGIFPLTMTLWSIAVIFENQDNVLVILAALSIFYVGACAAFRQNSILKSQHYIAAMLGIGFILVAVYSWYPALIIIWLVLTGLTLLSKYKIYFIETITIIIFYIFYFCS